jgi:hypothetical protein
MWMGSGKLDTSVLDTDKWWDLVNTAMNLRIPQNVGRGGTILILVTGRIL